MKRAAIYCRVSTAAQAEDDKVSLAEQLADCETYCEAQGYEVVDRYQDIKSGTTSQRPDFQRMLATIGEGAFDVVVCWKVDRLGRGLFPMARLLEACEPQRVGIEAVKERADPAWLGVMASIGKIELDNIRERTTANRRAYAKQGKWPGGVPRYGYRRGADGMPEIAPEEQAVLVEAAQRYADGESAMTICRDLRARNVPTRLPKTIKHAAWSKANLLKLITDEAYYSGQRVYGDVTVAYPPLYSDELWQGIQAARTKNTQSATRNTREEYLLQHLLYCKECGLRMAPSTRRTSWERRAAGYIKVTLKTPIRRFRCTGQEVYDYKCRDSRAINATLIEDAVWQRLLAALNEPDVLLRGLRARMEALETEALPDATEAGKELARLKVESLNVARLRVQGKIDDARLDLLDAENQAQTAYWQERANAEANLRADRESARRALENAAGYVERLRERIANADRLPFAKRRELVTTLVDRVWLDKQNRLTIDGILADAPSNSGTVLDKGAAQRDRVRLPFTLDVSLVMA